MLPSAKNTAFAGLAALMVASAAAAPAMAWGKKEQGFVAGVATAIIIDKLIEGERHRKQHTPPPVYVAPQPAPPPAYVPPKQPYYGSVHSTPAAQAFKSYSYGERQAIQRKLRAYGYYHGAIDGVFGTGTYNAVVAYARAAGVSKSLQSAGGAYAVYDGLIYR